MGTGNIKTGIKIKGKSKILCLEKFRVCGRNKKALLKTGLFNIIDAVQLVFGLYEFHHQLCKNKSKRLHSNRTYQN